MKHGLAIWLHAEIHPLNEHGECSGNPDLRVSKKQMVIPASDFEKAKELLDAIEEFLSEIYNGANSA